MYVLTREEMQHLDRYTIETFGLPGRVLMENAGRSCAVWLDRELLEPESRVGVVCGTGNNGGDGYVVARRLHEWGHDVVLFTVGDEAAMTPDTRANCALCRSLGLQEVAVGESDTPDLTCFDLVIDALFGIGLKGELRGWSADVVQAINTCGAPVAAIDIPSGVDADTGVAGVAVQADVTLTMHAPKVGHLLGQGRALTGELVVVDIGIPRDFYALFPPVAELNTEPILPVRDPLGHKGSFGRIGVLAGSTGYTGAAVMSTWSALRAGGGLVTLFHPAGLNVPTRPEVMSFPTDDEAAFLAKLGTMDAILAGPGTGTDAAAERRLELVVRHTAVPLVLDADALTILARRPDLLSALAGRSVLLTPHPGEFERLLGADAVGAAPLARLAGYVVAHGVNVLLKGATSVYCEGGCFVFNVAGNDGLATGGSGDVLAGIIVSFLAQGLCVRDAAVGGAHLLGSTAEYLAERRGAASILPTDVIENLFVTEG